MATSDDEQQPMAACGACSAVIPIDSSACPECGIRLAGEQQRWECGACGELFDHEPRSCSACGVVFVADDVVNVLRDWLSSNSMTVIDLFSRFDTNGDGIIDSSELKQGLLALNLAALPPDQVDILVQSIDENGDGSIDLNELQTTLDMDDVAIEEASADEGDGSLEFSENVLDRVMAEHGISEDDRAAFLEHAASFNEDENSYLKQDELKQAAAAWVELHAEGEEAEEASEEPFDQAPAEDEAEDLEEEADAEEPEATEDSIDEDADQADEEEDTSDDEPEEDESESDVSIEDDEDEEDEAEEDEGEEDEVEEDESEDLGVDTSDPFGALLEALDDMDITQMFHEVDTDGSGSITVDELHEAINTFTGLSFSRSQVEEIAQRIDEDSDGSIDRIEFIAAIEEQDGVVEPVVIPEKPFPSPMQKRMMSKRWNDVVWPLLHASFALLLLLLFVNALVGPVDGAGGRVAFEPSAAHEASFGESYYDPITKETYFPGDIYDCEPTAQEGKCRNSLAPLAGIEGETGIPSMPAGFYWDAWLAIFIAGAGLVATLATHYAIVPGWRARARAMKELELDHEAANSEEEDEDADDEEYDDEEYDDEEYDDEEYDDEEYDDEEYDDEEYDDEEYEDAEYDDEAHDEEATEQDEDPIDIGSHVGLEVDGVDYFGTIVEFDDDEGTVTIEEDETGETIVGDQDAMFLE